MRFGILYASNTLGAVFGAFLSGFFLIEALGVRDTLYFAASINLCVGVAALALSHRADRQSTLPVGSGSVSSRGGSVGNRSGRAPGRGATAGASHDGRGDVWRVQAGARRKRNQSADDGERADSVEAAPAYVVDTWLFVSGIVAMGYELVWIRTSIPYLKATTYAFSAILCVYLLGYASGILGGSFLLKKIAMPLRTSRWLMQGIGLCAILYMSHLIGISTVLSAHFSEWNNHLIFRTGRYYTVIYSGFLFMFPSFMMGLNLPVLVQLRKAHASRTGHAVASAYFVNTLGSVVGPLLTGFVLIPLVGSQRAIQALGLLSIASVFISFKRVDGARGIAPSAVLLSATLALVLLGPRNDYRAWLNKLEGKDEATELVDVLEGVTTTASVHHYVAQNFDVITTAGINVAADQIALRQTKKRKGTFQLFCTAIPTAC